MTKNDEGDTPLTKAATTSKIGLLSFFFFFCLFRATPTAQGGSQARGRIRAVAAGHVSHARSQPRLQPTPQLAAMLDPEPTEQGQGLNLRPHGYQSDSFPVSHDKYTMVTKFLKAKT